MLADVAALSFSLLAVVLSVALYVSGVTNRIMTSRTQRNQVRASLVQGQVENFKTGLAEQQEKLSRLSDIDSSRPAIVSEISTLANWNNNSRLRELLIKHGFDASRPQSSGK